MYFVQTGIQILNRLDGPQRPNPAKRHIARVARKVVTLGVASQVYKSRTTTERQKSKVVMELYKFKIASKLTRSRVPLTAYTLRIAEITNQRYAEITNPNHAGIAKQDRAEILKSNSDPIPGRPVPARNVSEPATWLARSLIREHARLPVPRPRPRNPPYTHPIAKLQPRVRDTKLIMMNIQPRFPTNEDTTRTYSDG